MPKGDATWPTMTIDECISFADEWSCGMPQQEIAQRWRSLCMLLAEEVRAMREKVEAAKAGEREMCARVCEDRYQFTGDSTNYELEQCAAAIRARGDK